MKKLGLLYCLPLFLSAGNLPLLVELALKNPLVESSLYTLEASKNKSASVSNGYLPSLTIGATQSFNQEEMATSPDKSTTGYAKLSYVIYDGGKRSALIDQQEALVKSASYSLESVKNEVALKVIYNYYAYLSTLSNKEALEQKLEQINAEKYRLEKFLSVGSATADELQKILSSIEQTKVQLLQNELSLRNISNTLEYLSSQKVSVEAGSTLLLPQEQEKQRFDILALEAAAKSAKYQAAIAKAPSLPTLSIDDTYSRFNYDYSNKAYDGGYDRQNTLALNVQWKIFDFGSTRDAYEAAYKEYLAKQSQLSYEKNRAKASLNSAHNGYEIALKKVESSQARLKAATMTYELIQKKFQNGIVNNVVFLDALSDKYSAISELQTSIYDVEYQKAVVLFEMGKEIKGAIQ